MYTKQKKNGMPILFLSNVIPYKEIFTQIIIIIVIIIVITIIIIIIIIVIVSNSIR